VRGFPTQLGRCFNYETLRTAVIFTRRRRDSACDFPAKTYSSVEAEECDVEADIGSGAGCDASSDACADADAEKEKPTRKNPPKGVWKKRKRQLTSLVVWVLRKNVRVCGCVCLLLLCLGKQVVAVVRRKRARK